MVKALSAQGFYLLYGSLDAACFLCAQKETGGVVFDCVTDLKKGERIGKELRERYPEMPIAVVLPASAQSAITADLTVWESMERQAKLSLLSDFLQHLCATNFTRLSTYALTVEQHTKEAHYMGYPLRLTPKEHRLLHCLLYRAPYPTTADDLLTLCYPGEEKSISNIHVHIHHINQKAARIHPAPLILCGKDGYRLRNGIL